MDKKKKTKRKTRQRHSQYSKNAFSNIRYNNIIMSLERFSQESVIFNLHLYSLFSLKKNVFFRIFCKKMTLQFLQCLHLHTTCLQDTHTQAYILAFSLLCFFLLFVIYSFIQTCHQTCRPSSLNNNRHRRTPSATGIHNILSFV